MSSKQTLQIQTIPPGIDDGAVSIDLPESPERRGALGLLSRGGLAMVGGLAAVLASATPAAADCQGSPCCSLASCNKCSGSCHWTCPSGYYRKFWWCAAGARFIGCGECQNVNDACEPTRSTRWSCSVWWDDAYCP